jgi:hypothetical integral membrane protein (TIGR02206 family)
VPPPPARSTLLLEHLALVALYFALVALLIWWARHPRLGGRDELTRRRTDVTLAALGALVSLAVNAWWFWPGHFRLAKSLPLELCDVVGVIAPLALYTGKRPLRALLQLWGLGLCTQWVFTPVTPTGPATLAYWLSFALHASILGSAAFDLLARGFVATWREWRLALLLGTAYLAAMVTVDLALIRWGAPSAAGANYGYVGPSTPQAPTIVEALGPWPLRLVWIWLLGAAALTVVRAAAAWVGQSANDKVQSANRSSVSRE